MTDSKNLIGYCFAAITNDRGDILRKAIESYAGTIVFSDAFTDSDLRDTVRIQRQSVSQFANQLLTGELDFVVFVTAAGLNYFMQLAAKQIDRQRIIDSLSDITTVAGSAAAARAFESIGVEPSISLVDPTSWRDVLIAMDHKVRVANFNVGLEESDSIHGLSSGIEARGGRVYRLPIYPQSTPTQKQSAIDFFGQLVGGNCQAVLFSSPADVSQFCLLAKSVGRSRWLGDLNDSLIILSLNLEATELLSDRKINVDYTSANPIVEEAVAEIAHSMKEIENQKQIVFAQFAGPATSGINPNAPWYESPFMKACRGEATDVTPIWLLQQGGRYMQEYRDLRANVDLLDLYANPQLCSEVSCTAVNRLGVDAAVLFSNLLSLLVPMGVDLEFVKGEGPQIRNPLRSAKDIRRIRRLENNDELSFVMEAVTQTRTDLPDDIPLIGFAVAPFSLASYMIEGRSGRNHGNTKKLMFTDQGAWIELMQHLANSISVFLNGQIAAGAQAVLLIDSGASSLAFDDYKNYVQPYVKQIVGSLPRHVPVVNFAPGNPSLLPLLADTRAAVIGLDWRVRLDQAWETVGHTRSVQGNLDPAVLLTDPNEIRRQAKQILDQAAGRPGHIFNLGHEVLPQTAVENVIALVEAVHELSQGI